MQLAEDIGFERVDDEDYQTRLQLTHEGKPLFAPLPGETLAGALRSDDVLVAITCETSFEGEDVNIVVLNGAGDVIDHCIVSDSFSEEAGEAGDIRIDGPQQFSFALVPGSRFHFDLSRKRRWRIPNLFSSSLIYAEGFAFRGHLIGKLIREV